MTSQQEEQWHEDLLTVSVQSSSNIVEALHQTQTQNFNKDYFDQAIPDSINSLNGLLKNSLQLHTSDEPPLVRKAAQIHVKAKLFKVHTKGYSIASEKAKFTLPPTVTRTLRKDWRKTSDGVTSRARRQKRNVDEEGDDEVMTEEFGAVMMEFQQNPYPEHDEEIDSTILSLDLYRDDGSKVKVENLEEGITITFPRKAGETPPPTDVVTLHKSKMTYHTFTPKNTLPGSMLHVLIDFRPVPDGMTSFPVAFLLGNGFKPNLTHYVYKDVFAADQNQIKISLPPSLVNRTATFGLVDALYNSGPQLTQQVQTREYTLHIFQSSCVFYDPAGDRWLGQGCRALSTSTLHETQCICTHLTTFGAKLDLLPNDLELVDIETLFDLEENPVTFSLMATLVVIYLVLFVICFKLDQHDLKKDGVVYLKDNNTSDHQKYIIVLETGFRRGAGTTAKVSLVLHGEEGMSETRELVSDVTNQPLFERNSRDVFIMTLPENIGPIWKIQLWHNNAGRSPSWYLSRVMVHDCTLDKTYYFSCEKWLAVEVDDGKVEREFMALDSETGLSFDRILWIKGTQYFADLHLWTSVLTRPSYSRFLKMERLTCCLTLILSYMAVSAAWYKQYEQEYRGTYGLLDVTWRSVAVGVATTALVLPVNLLIVLLFRRSEILFPRRRGDPGDEFDDGEEPSTSPLRSAHLLSSQSLLEQSVKNWQSLQQWAQMQWVKKYQNSSIASTDNVKPIIIEQKQPELTVKEKNEQNLVRNLIAEVGGASDSKVEKESERIVENESERRVENESQSKDGETTGMLVNKSNQAPTALGQQQQTTLVRQRSATGSERSSCTITGSHVPSSVHYSSAKHGRRPAPSGLRVLAWVLCFLVCGASGTLTVMYGFRFGYHKSIMWLQSMFFSFLACFFLSHPIMICVLTVYTAVRYRGSLRALDHHNDLHRKITNKINKHRKLHHDQDQSDDLEKGIAARQRSRYLRFARPPQEKQLIESRNITIRERKAKSILWKSVIYIIFLSVTLVIAFAKDNYTPYLINQSVRRAFFDSAPLSSDWSPKRVNPAFFGLIDIEQPHDWWKWSMTTFLDGAYWEEWYNGQKTAPETGKMPHALDGAVYRIGPALLSQRRVADVDCTLANSYPRLQGPRDSCKPAWNGRTTSGLNETEIESESAELEIRLSDDRSEALETLKRLESSEWIQRDTSSVTVRILFYHPPTRIFVPVHLESEFTRVGRVSSYLHVQAVRVYRYTGTVVDKVLLACELVFICLVLMKIQIFLTGWLRDRTRYFRRQPWHYADLFVIVTSLVYVIMYLLRYVFVYDVIDRMRQTFYKEHVDLWFVVTWDQVISCLVGLILFVVMLDMIRLLRYDSTFSRYLRVYKRARREIVAFLILALCLLAAFTSLGLSWFRTGSRSFMSLAQSLMTSCSLLVFRGQVLEQDNLVDTYYVRFFIASVFIFSASLTLTYIAVVFIYFFHSAKPRDHELTMGAADTVKFYWSQIKRLFVRETDTKGHLPEQEAALPAEFTLAEVQYQVDELLFKMNAIAGTHNLPEKAELFFTDSDCTYSSSDPQGAPYTGVNSPGGKVNYFTDSEYSPNEDGVSNAGVSDPPSEKGPFTSTELTKTIQNRLGSMEKVLTDQEKNLKALCELDEMASGDRSKLEMEIFRRLQLKRQDATMDFHVTESPNQSLDHNDQSEHVADDHISSVSDTDQIDQSQTLKPATSQSKLSNWSSRHSLHRHKESPRIRNSLSESSLLELNQEIPEIPIYSLDDEHCLTTQYVDFCDDFFDDSSTSSEVSAPRSAVHSLRKTKSRGKGKTRNTFFGSTEEELMQQKDSSSGSDQTRNQSKSKKKSRW